MIDQQKKLFRYPNFIDKFIPTSRFLSPRMFRNIRYFDQNILVGCHTWPLKKGMKNNDSPKLQKMNTERDSQTHHSDSHYTISIKHRKI